MPNRKTFATTKPPDAVNAAGGSAFARSDEESLAQMICTGCGNDGAYVSAEKSVAELVALANKVSPVFLAKATVYARRFGKMKDMPTLGIAVLSRRDPALCRQVFHKVIDNGRMVRGLVQIVGSGVAGRKSLGTVLKRGVARWFEQTDVDTIYRQSVGNAPTLGFCVKLSHPKVTHGTKHQLFRHLMGQADVRIEGLPQAYHQLAAFTAATNPVACPPLPFEMLANACPTPLHWSLAADVLSWDALRRNLNVLKSKGAFDVPGCVERVAARLRLPPPHGIMPYAAYTALLFAEDMPNAIRDAMHAALERSVENVPSLPGKVLIAVDVSGSMRFSVTGYRQGATSKMRLVDVASLFACSFWRRAQDADLIAVDLAIRPTRFERLDTLATCATQLGGFGGGGTNLSLVVEHARWHGPFDVVYLVSDNESWQHAETIGETMAGSVRKLILHDLTPNATTQARTKRDRVLNVGGFSDAVFDVIEKFVIGRQSWTDVIEETIL